MTGTIFPVPLLRDKHFFLLSVVHKTFRIQAQKKLHAHFDITFEMLCALTIIWGSQPLNQQTLADLVITERSAAKRLVDNLIKRQLVVVGASETNRKYKILSLTAEGERVMEGAGQIMDATEAEFLQVFTEDEKKTFLALSHKLVKANLPESNRQCS